MENKLEQTGQSCKELCTQSSAELEHTLKHTSSSRHSRYARILDEIFALYLSGAHPKDICSKYYISRSTFYFLKKQNQWAAKKAKTDRLAEKSISSRVVKQRRESLAKTIQLTKMIEDTLIKNIEAGTYQVKVSDYLKITQNLCHLLGIKEAEEGSREYLDNSIARYDVVDDVLNLMTPEELDTVTKFQRLVEQRNKECDQELKMEIKNYSRI
jgi:hypothetical protein